MPLEIIGRRGDHHAHEQQQRQKELEEYKKYVKTKKFVEEVAKNKFGLLYPDEILIKPDD